jgi:hypothetical protein
MGKFTASVTDHLLLPARVRLLSAEERSLADLGGSVPATVPIRLIIDTGAKCTTLIPGVLDHLRPTSGARARLVTPQGLARIGRGWVWLEFPEAGLAAYPEVLVARMPLPRALARFHGLLGRDLLGRLESFEYLGRRRQYSLRDTPGWLGWLRRRL